MNEDHFLSNLITSLVVGIITYFSSKRKTLAEKKKVEAHIEESENRNDRKVEEVKTQLTVVIENDCKKEIVYLLTHLDAMNALIQSHLSNDGKTKEDIDKIQSDTERYERWMKAFHAAMMAQEKQIQDIYKALNSGK